MNRSFAHTIPPEGSPRLVLFARHKGIMAQNNSDSQSEFSLKRTATALPHKVCGRLPKFTWSLRDRNAKKNDPKSTLPPKDNSEFFKVIRAPLGVGAPHHVKSVFTFVH